MADVLDAATVANTFAEISKDRRKRTMGREQAIIELKKCQKQDEEAGHWNADRVLCELLRNLGYTDVVDEWEKVGKWYA